MLTAKEAAVLYRARWQVELLFKRWKSQDLVAVLSSGSTVVRQMVRVWSRLLAALVQHWLVERLGRSDEEPEQSLRGGPCLRRSFGGRRGGAGTPAPECAARSCFAARRSSGAARSFKLTIPLLLFSAWPARAESLFCVGHAGQQGRRSAQVGSRPARNPTATSAGPGPRSDVFNVLCRGCITGS